MRSVRGNFECKYCFGSTSLSAFRVFLAFENTNIYEFGENINLCCLIWERRPLCRFWMPQRSKIPTQVSTPAICGCHASFNKQNSLNYNGILSVFLRYIYKREERKIRFYRCPRPSLYSKWSHLINRKDFKITKDTKVCSNHFKAGKPTKEDPIPSLYLKGLNILFFLPILG